MIRVKQVIHRNLGRDVRKVDVSCYTLTAYVVNVL